MTAFGTSSGTKVPTQIHVGTSGGNKQVMFGYIGTAGGNKLFYVALTATTSPNFVDGFGGTNNIITSSATVTPVGGVGPYAFNWHKISGDDIVINSGGSTDTASFRGNLMSPGESRAAFYGCTVTDLGTGVSVESDPVLSVTVARAP